jgi:hypothetical protein
LPWLRTVPAQLAVWPACVACAALGVWLAMQPAHLLPFWGAAAGVVVGMAVCCGGIGWFVLRNGAPSPGLVLAAILVCSGAGWAGFGWAQVFGHLSLNGSLDPAEEGQDIAVTGIVATLPQRI